MKHEIDGIRQIMIRFLRLTAAIFCACVAASAHPARPFVTDDARIVDPGGCQIESFVKSQRRFGETELWFLPGCTPAGTPVELTLGGLRIDNAADGKSAAIIGQAKMLLKPLETNGWGAALTLGATRVNPVSPPPGSHWSPYFNLVSSFSYANDATVIHANLGSTRDTIAGATRLNWGLGTEIAITQRLYGIAESYALEAEKPSTQVGLRFWAVPNRLQFDGTLGSQSATRSRAWISLGVRALF